MACYSLLQIYLFVKEAGKKEEGGGRERDLERDVLAHFPRTAET